MRKKLWAVLALGLLLGCDSHDPILPGVRTAVFDDTALTILNEKIDPLPAVPTGNAEPCPYTQDAENVIWDGDRKVFSGFPTSNSVKSNQSPVCAGGFIYAGLTTGEVVKLNPKTRQIAWVADVVRPSNMTGGASVVDIVAPLVVSGKSVYAGGLGDAVCRLRVDTGVARWCTSIGTAHPFVVTDSAIFVMATDGNLYALRATDGAVYWRAAVRRAGAPTYDGETVTVGRQRYAASDGAALRD